MVSSVFTLSDKQTTLDAVAMCLKTAGIAAAGTGTAAETGTRLASTEANVLLIDLSGDDFREALAAGSEAIRRHGLPVVYLYEPAFENRLPAAAETGPAGFLKAPFTAGELAATLSLCRSDHEATDSRTIEDSSEILVRIDAHGKIRCASEPFRKRFFPAGRETVGIFFLDCVYEADRDAIPIAREGTSAPPPRKAIETRCRTTSGWRWFRWRLKHLDANGQPLLELRGEDVSREKFSEEHLGRLSQAVEQCPLGILIADTHGTIEYANSQYTEMSGYALEEILDSGMRLLDTATLPTAERAAALTGLQAGESWSKELRERKRDGSSYWASVRLASIFDSTGRRTHLLMVAEDITERRAMEERIREAQKMENLGTLSSGIAHDFNNIIASISGYIELALMDRSSPSLVESHLNRSRTALDRATELVKRILNFSRAASSEFKPIQVNEVIRELVAMASDTLQRTVVFETELANDLPPIEADPNQIYQVLLNAVINARDAMDGRGTITVQSAYHTEAQLPPTVAGRTGGSRVRISVTDTGTGIDQSTLNKIFQPFFTTKPEGRGTGLGLAVTRGIVRNHNGQIDVATRPGAGTTFSFYFPVSDTSAVSADGPAPYLG